MSVHIYWKRIFYNFLGCILIVGISAFVSLFGPAMGQDDITVLKQLPDQDGVFFLGHLYQINVPNRTVSVSWLVGGCGKFTSQTADKFPGSKCGPANVPIKVYINGKSRFNYNPALQPIFNSTTNNTIYVQALNEFQYTHTIDISTQVLGKTRSRAFEQQYLYPFEQYILMTTFIAFNTATNTPLPILELTCSDTADNFQPWPVEQLETKTRMNNTLMDSRTAHVSIKRTISAQFFVMLLVLLNWILTMMVIYATTIALWSKTEPGESIIFLPMTMILTLPTLRKLFVDAPSFGVFLDSLGLIIQMFIVAICTGATMLLGIHMKPKPPQRSLNLENASSRRYDE